MVSFKWNRTCKIQRRSCTCKQGETLFRMNAVKHQVRLPFDWIEIIIFQFKDAVQFNRFAHIGWRWYVQHDQLETGHGGQECWHEYFSKGNRDYSITEGPIRMEIMTYLDWQEWSRAVGWSHDYDWMSMEVALLPPESSTNCDVASSWIWIPGKHIWMEYKLSCMHGHIHCTTSWRT